ncbi:unnamed protein product [Laminaria digitata]
MMLCCVCLLVRCAGALAAAAAAVAVLLSLFSSHLPCFLRVHSVSMCVPLLLLLLLGFFFPVGFCFWRCGGEGGAGRFDLSCHVVWRDGNEPTTVGHFCVLPGTWYLLRFSAAVYNVPRDYLPFVPLLSSAELELMGLERKLARFLLSD